MTEEETGQTEELADIIVKKFRDLFALESRVLEAREQTNQTSVISEVPTAEGQKVLTALELQLKTRVEEMEKIIDELKSTTPSFRTYVLPRVSEVVGTLKTSDTTEQEELTQLVTALTDGGNARSLEQLEAVIITRLRDNLKKSFGT